MAVIIPETIYVGLGALMVALLWMGTELVREKMKKKKDVNK